MSTAAAKARSATTATPLRNLAEQALATGFLDGSPDEEQVIAWIDARLPGVARSVHDSIAKEILAKIQPILRRGRRRQRAVPASSSSSPSSTTSSSTSCSAQEAPPPKEDAQHHETIGNKKGKVTHKVRVGPAAEANPRRWLTACGWEFGCSKWGCS